ncbi:hypothetical protein KHM83_11090 [Fusibacter paucivorans]|uniref:Uncharacterized protein n=1 Tax=Fusibacter paucivorans TaxID=76009 RepID=A0ABS5PS83_9FIRM|nr:hypothetical protein [Fusibacter paucivorans]MBS7527226.1 hypothetical protein [Fusibacter paucivorans]
MLDLIYYSRDGLTKNVCVTDTNYERLAMLGLANIVTYEEKKVVIEGDEYSINAATLNYSSRKLFINLLEDTRHSELVKLFEEMDIKPTVKEIREQFDYVKLLTHLCKEFKDENNIYFSYE